MKDNFLGDNFQFIQYEILSDAEVVILVQYRET